MASFEAKVIGRIRKLLEGIDIGSAGDDGQLTLSGQLEQLIAQGAAPYSEITRMGRSFWAGTTAAIAAVVATPTTAHMFSLYNNAPDGGRSLIIDFVAAQNVVSVTATANQAQIIVNVGQLREAAPADAALSIKKLNGYGQAGPDTAARTLLNGTPLPAATGVAANWVPWGQPGNKTSTTANTGPGYGMWAPVDGRIIIPPGRYFAMHVVANVVGETFFAYVGWHEKQLGLG